MWIQSIKLKNFKSYEEAEFHFPEPKGDENIVLIGAENAHGKTTLLEAIYLCFYDKDAEEYLKRAGLNSNERRYTDFLNSALHHKAKARYGQFTMELEIEICERYMHAVKTFKIVRKWHFNQDRKLSIRDNEAHATIHKNGQFELNVDADEISNYLNSYALPMDYAPFFFFDGEKIVQQAEQSSTGKWLSSGLKGLIGITLLDRLRTSLRDYRNRCISENASQRIQADLEKAEKSLKTAETTLAVFQEELETVQSEWQYWAQERDRLQIQLGGGSDIRTSQDLVEQRAKLEQDMATFEAQVKAAVKAMPLAFLPRSSLKTLQTQLEHEKNRLLHEVGKERLVEGVDDFWQAFIGSEKVKTVLGRSAAAIFEDPLMKEAVFDCWEKLFYPLKSDCAQYIKHNYLSVDAHTEIQNEINKLQGMPNTQLGNLIAEIAKRKEERKQVLADIEALKDTNNDELVAQLKKANHETEKLKERVGHLKSNVLRQEKDKERLQREVTKLQDEISNSNPRLQKSRRAGEMDKVIEELTQRLLQRKVQAVGETATRINKNIMADIRIDQIKIEPDGKMVLSGRDGRTSVVDLSAGQMQILIMSLVSALAKVTDYYAPFVIDTPLARISSANREGLFQHWISLKQQVILLAQDTEITSEVYQRLKPHISKTYLVRAQSLDTMGARSEVIENAYFE